MKKTNRDARRELAAGALVEIRKLVKKFDLPSVQNAVKQLYDERAAQKALIDAEAKVQSLKKKLGA